MKKMSMLCLCAIILLLGAGAALAQPTYQFAEAGTKNFITETTISHGTQISLDLWLTNAGAPQNAGGAWIDFTASTAKISYVSGGRAFLDGSEGVNGPWTNGSGIFLNEPLGAGTVVYQVSNLGGAVPDVDGDLIVGTLTLECIAAGDVTVVLDVSDLVALWSPINDADIVSASLLIHQIQTCTIDDDCDDSQFCTGDETCVGGFCLDGLDPDCDDGVGCTDDSCDDVNDVCVSNPNDGNCDDGDFCTGVEACDAVSDCQAGTYPCPDDGLFCNGTESCIGAPFNRCVSDGVPCPPPYVCDEDTDTCDLDTDEDEDGIPNDQDNCPNHPNGPNLGTCYSWSGMTGACTGDNDCADFPNSCSMNQEDTYPPRQGNSIGDVCDCEGDFNCDGNVDATDVPSFLTDFGRSRFNNPCTNDAQCNGDFNCDGNVDAADVTKFLEDFGRNPFNNPCPACVVGDWCVYFPNDGVGGTCGDPHFFTFDGLYYHNQYIGEFVLSREIGGGGFEVHTRQGRLSRFSPCVTLNTAVAIRLDNNVVEYRASSNEILIDGTIVDLSEGNEQSLSGGGTIQRSGGIICRNASSNAAVRVRDFGDYLCITVYVDASMQGTLEGLLGNFDGNWNNDLKLRNGEEASSISTFMANWRLMDTESLFTYLPGENTGTYTGLQSCNIHLSTDDLNDANTQFGEEVCDEAMIIAIATDLAGGMTEAEVFDWIDDFQGKFEGECEIDILATRWYEDADGDEYGNPDVFVEAATQPTGYVPDNTDCDDADVTINPSVSEVCDDGVDNNCNGLDDECEGLVAYYPFNGNAQDEWDDHDGTVNGATLTEDRFGNADSAYSFDGVNDFIIIPYHPDIEPSVFSLVAWVKPSLTSAGTIISADPDSHYCNHGYYLWAYQSGVARFVLDPSGACQNGYGVVSTSLINDDTWHQIVAIYEPPSVRLYIDGVFDSEIPSQGYQKTHANLRVGRTASSVASKRWPFSGSIDDIRIYNGALTIAEIEYLYNLQE